MNRSSIARIDGPRPPEPSGAWQEAQDRPQTSRPRTRMGSADPVSAPGTGGGAPAQAEASRRTTRATERWGRMARTTILTPWASTPSVHTDGDQATCSTLEQPSLSASCSWPGRSFGNRHQAEEVARWKTRRSWENWRNVSSSLTSPPRHTCVQAATGKFPPASVTWSSCRSMPPTFAGTGTAVAGSDVSADPLEPRRSELPLLLDLGPLPNPVA